MDKFPSDVIWSWRWQLVYRRCRYFAAVASLKKIETKEKPLEKMTVTDLREMAKEIPDIVGVHGMKKEELIVAIKKFKGIVDAPVKKTDASLGEIKKKIWTVKKHYKKQLKEKKRKTTTIFKNKLNI